jgi:hypothetical protein
LCERRRISRLTRLLIKRDPTLSRTVISSAGFRTFNETVRNYFICAGFGKNRFRMTWQCVSIKLSEDPK